MQLPDAFTRLGGLSPDQRRQVLLDQHADETLRGVAALTLAKDRSLSDDQKATLLSQCLEFASMELKEYIVDALGYCQSPKAGDLLKELILEPRLHLRALASLARQGNLSVLPICSKLIRSGTDVECQGALDALSNLETPEVISLLEEAMRLARSESTRQYAAFLLALRGNSEGEGLLERQLLRLLDQQTEFEQRESDPEFVSKMELINVAFVLAEINNKTGLLVLKGLVEDASSRNADLQYLKNLTCSVANVPWSATYEEWKREFVKWIETRIK